MLGAILGTAALHGRDKVTLILDPEIATYGSWLEQLLAESSGKDGKGLVPVDLEPLVPSRYYGHDRIFIYLANTNKYSKTVEQLLKAGHPVLTFFVPDFYDLGAEFYRWEFATATACAVLGINAFDSLMYRIAKSERKRKLPLI